MSFPPNLGITSSFIIDYSTYSLVFQDIPPLLPPLDQICPPFPRSKMKGYSRIIKDAKTRSKSVDFADPSLSPNFSKFKPQEINPNTDNDEGKEKVFKIILSEKYTTPPARSDQKMMAEEERAPSKFKTVVKKADFIKRSSSVSEGYSRIHHQNVFTAGDDDQYGTSTTTRHRPKKKKGKFLEACRRLFGL